MNNQIGFVGGGNMTRAIAGGLVDSGLDPVKLFISEPDENARVALRAAFPGATICADNLLVVREASCVILAVKPNILAPVCRELVRMAQRFRPLFISIAAGVRSDVIDRYLGGDLSIIRVMPNQPALIRRGVSGMYANPQATPEECTRAMTILSSVGRVVRVNNESDIDIVTAVSGSGPAYFFLLIELLISTSVELGLNSDDAEVLAIETARGAAELAASQGVDMQELIKRVRSPGGTTEAALDSLDADGVRDIFGRAINAARDRAGALADDDAHRKP